MYGVMRYPRAVYFIAALFSILLSIWAAAKTTLINPDGICYLQSAATMPLGLSAATHLCSQAIWPFYSILLFGFVSMTKLSYPMAAFILNGFFTLISVLTFIAIVRSLTTSTRIVWLAALVVLLAHEFNSVRDNIIRDHGFWAFYLLSLFFFLQYFRQKQWHFALLWNVTLVIATLFRIEGAVFLLALPFAAWFEIKSTWLQRLRRFLRLNTITIFLGIVLLGWAMVHPQQQLGRLNEIQFQLLHGVSALAATFNATAQALAHSVLSVYSARDAHLILTLMLVSWYTVSVSTNLSLIYTVLVVYAWWKKLARLDTAANITLWSYVVVNVFITAAFLVSHMFLSKRYLMALSLVLMLWVPFALDNLIQQWRVRKWPLILAAIFIVISAWGGIVGFGYSKQYIRQAADWLVVNAPPHAKIYSNDYQLLYHSNRFGNTIFIKGPEFADLAVIKKGKWRHYDYLALRFNKKTKDSSITKEISLVPVKIFMNTRGDEVVIYKVVH